MIMFDANKGYEFSPWLIADNVPLMEQLRGEFSCQCDWLEHTEYDSMTEG